MASLNLCDHPKYICRLVYEGWYQHIRDGTRQGDGLFEPALSSIVYSQVSIRGVDVICGMYIGSVNLSDHP